MTADETELLAYLRERDERRHETRVAATMVAVFVVIVAVVITVALLAKHNADEQRRQERESVQEYACAILTDQGYDC